MSRREARRWGETEAARRGLGYDGESDSGFALGEKLLARYEGAEVTADKPNIRPKIVHKRFQAEFMPGPCVTPRPLARVGRSFIRSGNLSAVSSRRETTRGGAYMRVLARSRKPYRGYIRGDNGIATA